MTEAEAITGPTLVYFGYTFCPDVCPMDLSRNALAAADRWPSAAIDVGQVFITIDPERDTPEVVRDYAAAIDPALVGLTGTPEEIAAAAEAYKVYYRKARRRSRLLPDGPLDLHLPDGAGRRLPRVLPLRGDPRGGGRLGRLLRRAALNASGAGPRSGARSGPKPSQSVATTLRTA